MNFNPYGAHQGFYYPQFNYQLNPGYYDASYDGYDQGYDQQYAYNNEYDHYQVPAAHTTLPRRPQRPRSPSPPPPPATPSEEYIATSLSPQPSSMPPGQRKLVIFDLNSTLLLRSPSRAGVRQIYLRPYARPLVAYLAHPNVRNWLDCMVWSSAQPHNVSQMVDRVFGAGEGAGKGPILRAVWARDTLGLSKAKFHQKTQTTKDLSKPWDFFAPKESTASAFPTHGPETTLLVDDSPLKARLQPWNHLCVAEYDAQARIRDLAAAGLPPDSPNNRPPADLPKPSTDKDASTALESSSDAPASQPEPSSSNPDSIHAQRLRDEVAALAEEANEALAVGDASALLSKDRWRKRRRKDAAEEDTEGVKEEFSVPEAPEAPKKPGPSKRSLRKQRKKLKQAVALAKELGLAPHPVAGPSSDAAEVPTEDDGVPAEEPQPAPADLLEDPESAPSPSDAQSKKRKREPEGEEETAPTSGEPYDPTLLAVVGVFSHIRSVANVAAWMRSGGLVAILQGEEESESAENEVLPSDPAQWFTSSRLLAAWAERGRVALRELEIDVAPGVE